MASLMNSPAEIRLSIAKFLPTSDLYSLSLVSKNFHTLVESTLYAEIEANFWSSEIEAMDNQSWSALPHKDVHPLTLLLRTLLARPELCNHILVLEIYKPGGGREWDSLFTSTDELDVPSAIDAIMQTGVPEYEA